MTLTRNPKKIIIKTFSHSQHLKDVYDLRIRRHWSASMSSELWRNGFFKLARSEEQISTTNHSDHRTARLPSISMPADPIPPDFVSTKDKRDRCLGPACHLRTRETRRRRLALSREMEQIWLSYLGAPLELRKCQ